MSEIRYLVVRSELDELQDALNGAGLTGWLLLGGPVQELGEDRGPTDRWVCVLARPAAGAEVLNDFLRLQVQKAARGCRAGRPALELADALPTGSA